MANKEFPFAVCFILDNQEEANTLKNALTGYNFMFGDMTFCAEHNFWECRILMRRFSNSYYSQACRALGAHSLAFVIEPNF